MAKDKTKATATIGEYTIVRKESDSVEVYKIYDNTVAALREIAAEIGFTYDPSLNSRRLGAKLIDHLNK